MTIGIFAVAVEGGGVALGWLRGGCGVEIRVTNYLAHFTPSLRADFEVEKKMSDVSVCLSANLKTDIC